MSTRRVALHCGLAGLLALGLAPQALQAADRVSGEFVLDGTALAPTEVAAFRIRDQFAPRSFQTWVMLTTSPVDVAAIAGDLEPYALAINLHAAVACRARASSRPALAASTVLLQGHSTPSRP